MTSSEITPEGNGAAAQRGEGPLLEVGVGVEVEGEGMMFYQHVFNWLLAPWSFSTSPN